MGSPSRRRGKTGRGTELASQLQLLLLRFSDFQPRQLRVHRQRERAHLQRAGRWPRCWLGCFCGLKVAGVGSGPVHLQNLTTDQRRQRLRSSSAGVARRATARVRRAGPPPAVHGGRAIAVAGAAPRLFCGAMHLVFLRSDASDLMRISPESKRLKCRVGRHFSSVHSQSAMTWSLSPKTLRKHILSITVRGMVVVWSTGRERETLHSTPPAPGELWW